MERIAAGRVWSGQDAKRLGLVDQLGTLDEAVAAAEREAANETDDAAGRVADVLGSELGVDRERILAWTVALQVEMAAEDLAHGARGAADEAYRLAAAAARAVSRSPVTTPPYGGTDHPSPGGTVSRCEASSSVGPGGTPDGIGTSSRSASASSARGTASLTAPSAQTT